VREVFGYSAEHFLNRPLFLKEIIHPDFVKYFEGKWSDLIEGNVPTTYEYKIIDPGGNERWILQSNKGIFDNQGNIIAIEGLCRNITKRKQTEKEREKLIAELQEALAKVKTLSRLLPICASCKKIRDDKGYWSEIEEYITEHTDTLFSHGMCPDCMKKMYPDFYKKEE
jgi:PAS domain S-box-containing protein